MRHLRTPLPKEETFTEMLMRNLRTPPPREETFSEMLAQNLQKPLDFRTEGERRRDARQAEACCQ